MGVEPLQDVPFLNLLFHWLVFLVSVFAMVTAYIVWRKYKTLGDTHVIFTWKLLFFGFLFYSVSEYSDLYTPGLKASLGVHNYFTEGSLLVGIAFIFIALKRLVERTDMQSNESEHILGTEDSNT